MKATVTGGAGFLGKAVVYQLRDLRGWDVSVPRSAQYDLRTVQGIEDMLDDTEPDIIIHLAAAVGGIGANIASPGRFFYENAIMGIELMERARRRRVEKFVTVGTTCEYPQDAPMPLREASIWDGHPTPATSAYGLAKRSLLAMGQAYRQEYGFNSIHLLPTNLYGPGDNIDPELGHVIPSLVHRFVEAAKSDAAEVVCWGTGLATRDFLYIDDAARGVAQATADYDGGEPVNLGSGVETTMMLLAEMIAYESRFRGEITWDKTKPEGQPRRVLDISRARAFGWKPEVGLPAGIQRTVRWLRGLA